MKSLLAALLLTTLLPTAAFARPPSPEQRLAQLSEDLQLTTEQQQQVAAILTEGKVQHDALAQQYGADEDFHQQMRAVRQRSASDIEALLNAEQREQFEAMRQQHKAKRSQFKD